MNEMFSLLLIYVFQLFLIVDPIALMPVFLSITRDNTHKERIRMARISSMVASFILLIFAFFGSLILDYFHISISAIQIGGGMLLFFIGFEMTYGKYPGSKITDKEHDIAVQMDDVSIAPLATPLLAGPGAITTVLLFSGGAGSPYHYAALTFAILIIGVLSYVFLALSDRITSLIGELGTKVLVRLMGLMLVFISVQYFINGLNAVLF
ncbi:MAG: MarC family protein [archaeon]